jgi:pimeloyl-ACP methyl ester carboxylesterase
VLNSRWDGPADGPAIVLVHGLCESLRVWDLIVPALSRTFHVLRVDLLGFGESPESHGAYEIEEQARALVETVSGLSAAVLVGHSMGGAVVVGAAELSPELARGLVLINSPPTPESRMLSRAERALRTVVVGEAAWTLMGDRQRRAGLASAFAPGCPVPDVFVEAMAGTSHAAFSGASFALERFLRERDLGRRVAALGLPTTVIFGVEDQRVDTRSLSVYGGVASVRVERLAGVGHSPMWEAPERTAELISETAAT